LGTTTFERNGLGNNDHFAWTCHAMPFQKSDSLEKACGSPRGTYDAELASHIHGHRLHRQIVSGFASSDRFGEAWRAREARKPVGVGISRTADSKGVARGFVGFL
jgi:hypothetical protein